MFNLIKFEAYKCAKAKGLYICLIISLLTATLYGVIRKNSSVSTYARNYISFGLIETLMLGIVVGIIVCADSSQGTIKNIIAKGYSRKKLFVAKYVSTLVVSLLYALVCLLYAIMLGLLLSKKGGSISTADIISILLEMLGIIALHAMFFGISEMIEKTGGSIAINIAFPMVLSVALLGVDAFAEKHTNISFSDFTIGSAINEFADYTSMNSDIVKGILVCIVFTAVFLVAGFFVNKKKEI